LGYKYKFTQNCDNWFTSFGIVFLWLTISSLLQITILSADTTIGAIVLILYSIIMFSCVAWSLVDIERIYDPDTCLHYWEFDTDPYDPYCRVCAKCKSRQVMKRPYRNIPDLHGNNNDRYWRDEYDITQDYINIDTPFINALLRPYGRYYDLNLRTQMPLRTETPRNKPKPTKKSQPKKEYSKTITKVYNSRTRKAKDITWQK